jgi:hypothetical protein
MVSSAIRFFLTIGIATAAALNAATAQPSDKPQAASGAAALSAGFWTEYKAPKNSENIAALQKTMGSTENVNAAIAEGRKAGGQGIANVAVDRPADVAKMLDGIAAAPGGAANQAALETVLKMRTTAKARAAAVPLVSPAAKTQAVAMTANLSKGIPGLPGIYLGDNTQARPVVPQGYARVAGGSMGCRPR